MEGKAVIFKKLPNIDSFEIESNAGDPEKLAKIVYALGPTFGVNNLKVIKAPDCYIVEKIFHKRIRVPVFDDDQNDQAIVVGAAAINVLYVGNKSL